MPVLRGDTIVCLWEGEEAEVREWDWGGPSAVFRSPLPRGFNYCLYNGLLLITGLLVEIGTKSLRSARFLMDNDDDTGARVWERPLQSYMKPLSL